MDEPAAELPVQPTPASRRPRRRWLQISLRTLLLAIALVAVAALAASWYEAPYRKQREAMAAIEKAGGTYQASPAGPAWLRRLFGEDSFRNVTLVNVADCDDPAAYISHVAVLPALETLVGGGSAFTDEHLQQLHVLTTLSGLVLDCTEVTHDGLAALAEALPSVEVYQSERRAITALRKLGGKPGTMRNRDHAALEELVGAEWFEEAASLIVASSPSKPIPFHDADLALVRKLTHLQRLHLTGVRVTDAGLEQVREMTQLRTLILQRLPGVGDAGLAHLEALTELVQLDLEETNVSDTGLASLRRMPQLAHLSLRSTRVSDAGLAHLRSFTHLQNLELDGTAVGDAGMAHLKALPLKILRLTWTQVGDAGLVHLGELKELISLELEGTRITDAGMAHLRPLHELVFLHMNQTKVGDAGLIPLKELSQLHYLILRDTQVTDAGLQHIAGLPNLDQVTVPKQVSAAAIQKLNRALPKCRVRND